MRTLIVALAAALLASGCSVRVADLTYVTTKNIDVDAPEKYERVERVAGEDRSYIISFIPTGIPNLEEAIDNTIESVPNGVALENATIKRETFYIPLLFGSEAYVVEGDVVVEKRP
ncbi:hypothetical protein [Ferrimonas balearica]|uniref:hypothetical protein n=1 Tax=Ferrimonas balearica TaxID=44012 RepID=UPI001C99608D|nr:hypothetical protein [Ferrimonas balearica]MBY5992884.1 hypothetical protein [Ferrimonas balearica]